MINTTNFEQARKQIIASKEKPLVVHAQDNKFNRKALDYGKFDILLSPEVGKYKIGLKKLDSGLNHIMAKIATKNKIAIGINLEEIKKLPEKKKAIRLAQLKRNIQICKKANTKITILNTADKKNAFHLLLTLGASTQQAKEAIS